jgi:hypothetical protein
MARRSAVQEQKVWETVKLQGIELLDKLKQIIHEGNARRIIVRQGNRIVAEFPQTAGVVGTLLAPILAAIGALVALLKDCSIEVERVASDSGPKQSKPTDLAPNE